MTNSINPLLNFDDLPLFDQIQPGHIKEAVNTLLLDAEQALEVVTDASFVADWQSISRVLDVAVEKLSRAWGAVSHLNSVADTSELRAAYNESLPKVTAFYAGLGANEKLYAKYKNINPSTLNAEQLRAHQLALQNFVLGGAELTGNVQIRFAEIQERQAALSQKFSENVLDATDAYAYYATVDELDGLAQDVVQAARQAAQTEGRSGYKLTLKTPCYLPVMQFAHSRLLREKIYRAYVTRASDQASSEAIKFDNSSVIQELLVLRKEEANLLGYTNFGELSVVPKMAESPTQIIGFLRDLAAKARPFALKDVDDMRLFATEQLGLSNPQAWDWPYISEKLKEKHYDFSEQEVKPYFTAPKVLAGLFNIAESLFDIVISPDQTSVWNSDVIFYRIERISLANSNQVKSELLGQFYLDLSARSGKRGGAWMDDVRSRWLRPDTKQLQTPVAHLVCNFPQGQDGKPALLTHDDVTTLFHEFGHGLHHLLTQVNERDVSGISGVEWDAVELPSQFMENFCWEWNVIKNMTSHAETGEPLPRALFDKMLAAKNFQSGLQTLRQVEFSLFDMLLHTRQNSSDSIENLLQQVREEIAVIQLPAWSRTAHAFSHIFAGGYAAGYYSYKWAEVLSSDAYSALEESITADDLPNLQTGTKYRKEILETGGSRPAMESFKAFRGREPTLDALLRHQGLSVAV